MTVREPLTAHPIGARVATRLADLERALAVAAPAWLYSRAREPAHARSLTTTGQTESSSLNDGPRHRRKLLGGLAAMFFVGSGVVGLVTLPLPAPGLDKGPTAAVSAVALALGVAV